MIFLFGERPHASEVEVGQRFCPICNTRQPFVARDETLWFSVFGLPVLKLEEVASYWCCVGCDNSYVPGELHEPSQLPVVRQVIVYLLAGYGHHDQAELADEICRKLTSMALPVEAFRQLSRSLQTSRLDMVETVRSSASRLNAKGKHQVIQAAFLTTYVCCDLQYEDRLRINLMGNALGVGMEFTDSVIQDTRRRNCLGIRRLVQPASEV